MFDLKTRQFSQLPGSKGIFGPRWSPDGRYIVAISADGNNLDALRTLKTEKWRQLDTDTELFGYLTWSRDSAYVYFDTFLSKDSGFFRMRIRDAKMEKLADLKKLRGCSAASLAPAPGPASAPVKFPAPPRHQHPGDLRLRPAASLTPRVQNPSITLR